MEKAILNNNIVNTYSAIDEGYIINADAIVDHDIIIGNAVYVCIGAIVKVNNIIPGGIKSEMG